MAMGKHATAKNSNKRPADKQQRGSGKGGKGGKGGGGVDKQRGSSKRQKKGPIQLRDDVPLPEEHAGQQPDEEEEEEEAVSDEDLAFVQQHSESLGFLKNLDKAELDRSVKKAQKKDAARSQKRAAEKEAAEAAERQEQEGEEDDRGLEAYEKGPRKLAQDEGDEPKTRGLPIRTAEGRFMFTKDEESRAKRGPQPLLLPASELPKVEGITVEDEMEEAERTREEHRRAQEAQAARERQEGARQAQKKSAQAALPPALAQLQHMADREQRLNKAKEAMAVAASNLLSGPEDHVGELRVLTALLRDTDMQVCRLAMLSLLAVFRDIIPGYRIRPPTEKELETKVSKEVQAVRDYEAALLRHYQSYLKALLQHGLCVAQGTGPVAHARVAVRCMCQLLTTAPHFNYTSDLLQAVVPRMAVADAEIRDAACGAVRALLASPDTAGKVALEALQLVADLVRRRKCVCPPQVVQALSVLKFTQVTRKEDKEAGPKSGKKKELLKKKGEKRPRNQIDQDVDRDFKEAEAAVDPRTISKLQSQMLEALFEIYFRVLKLCTASPLLKQEPVQAQPQPQPVRQPDAGGSNGQPQGKGKKKGSAEVAAAALDNRAVAPSLGVSRARLLKRHPLLYPVLEGLAAYTHLISVEYFNDIMDVFHQLLRSPGLPLLERLRVLLTASDILRGQGEAVNVDRRESHVRLYQTLLSVPLAGLVDADAADRGPSSSDAAGVHYCNGAAAPGSSKPHAPGTCAGGGGGEGGRAGGADDADEASDPPGTAEVAAVAAGGRVGGAAAAGGAGTGERLVEEPLAVLLAGALHQTVCEPKIVDVSRLAAFAKRTATVAMSCGPAEALALLGCVLRLLRRYPRLRSLLEWEGEAPVGGRSFNPELADPSEAGALAAALWELQLLAHHYHPHVAQALAMACQ